MSDAVLAALTRQYLEARAGPEVTFAWQGGEPTLAGLDFYGRALALQEKHAAGRRIRNTLQTNGVLLGDDWGRFLRRHDFLVGISLDGPAALHDAQRCSPGEQPTHAATMRGVEVLRRHGIEFNTLTAVTRANARAPLAVYQFLKETGSRHMQFIPVVERAASGAGAGPGRRLGQPPGSAGPGDGAEVTPWSVEPEAYGGFLMAVFDRWVREDVGRIHVQLFEVALGAWLRAKAGLCLFAEVCGAGPVLERDGDVYACDHYAHAPYRLGNIADRSLAEWMRDPRQERFGRYKAESLPGYCRRCDYRFACQGECPKNRWCRTPDGEPGLNYLCVAYRRFFRHVDPCLRLMAQLLLAGRAPAAIMDILAQRC